MAMGGAGACIGAHVARWRGGGKGRAVRRENPLADRVAALIAWMLVVRVGELVEDGAKRRRLRRSTILDKFTNTNRNAVQAIKAAFWASDMSPLQVRNVRPMAGRCRRWHNTAPGGLSYEFLHMTTITMAQADRIID